MARSRYLEAARQFGTRLFDALLSDVSAREVYTAARRISRGIDGGSRRGSPT